MSEAADASESLIVVCDANVLYPIVLMDLILSLGSAELFYPRWTKQIHEEWMRNLLADRPELEPAKIERRRGQMDAAIDDCLIEGFEYLILTLTLPDQDDCHVLAAAIHGKAQVILTFNQRHFPKRALSPFGIAAQHPDDFLTSLAEQFAEEVREVIEEMRLRKTRPPFTQKELLRKIENNICRNSRPSFAQQVDCLAKMTWLGMRVARMAIRKSAHPILIGAREGLRFTRASPPPSSCNPSRASLITGHYPHNTDAKEWETAFPIRINQMNLTCRRLVYFRRNRRIVSECAGKA